MPDAERVQLRPAVAADEAAIAALHAESWQASYRGLLSDEFLDHDVVAERAALWRERFDPVVDQPITVTVLAELDGALVGFAHSIVDDDTQWGTLLDNLHVRPGLKRAGIGKRLMAETAARLLERRTPSPLYLWVLEGNAPARSFYAGLGGEVAERVRAEEGGAQVWSLRIVWPDVAALLRAVNARTLMA